MARPPAKVLRSQRFASRRRDVRRARQRRRRRVTFTMTGLVVLALGGWMFARSSLFALEQIDVAGTTLLERGEILNASGLRPGDNMLSLDLRAVERRIAGLPLIRTVSVTKPSPSHVRIVVTERAPSFVLETIEGRWLIDREAIVLGPITEADPTMPTVRFASGMPADTGDRIRSRGLEDAMSLWGSLPEPLRAGPPVIESTPGGLTLIRGGLVIRFGTMDRMDQKLEAVRLVLERAKAAKEHLTAIDVRSPSRPAATSD